MIKFKFSSTQLIVAIAIFALLMIGPDLLAQCPMCKAGAESNLKNGGTSGRGLNAGILYMLCMPYLLVATLGMLWWRSQRRKKMSEQL